MTSFCSTLKHSAKKLKNFWVLNVMYECPMMIQCELKHCSCIKRYSFGNIFVFDWYILFLFCINTRHNGTTENKYFNIHTSKGVSATKTLQFSLLISFNNTKWMCFFINLISTIKNKILFYIENYCGNYPFSEYFNMIWYDMTWYFI